MEKRINTPILFPYEPDEFWEKIRIIVRDEVSKLGKDKAANIFFETPGMTYKPLYKIKEVCSLLQVTRPTIYDWIKCGKLKPYKIRSRLYFLWGDIQLLLHP